MLVLAKLLCLEKRFSIVFFGGVGLGAVFRDAFFYCFFFLAKVLFLEKCFFIFLFFFLAMVLFLEKCFSVIFIFLLRCCF